MCGVACDSVGFFIGLLLLLLLYWWIFLCLCVFVGGLFDVELLHGTWVASCLQILLVFRDTRTRPRLPGSKFGNVDKLANTAFIWAVSTLPMGMRRPNAHLLLLLTYCGVCVCVWMHLWDLTMIDGVGFKGQAHDEVAEQVNTDKYSDQKGVFVFFFCRK
jgi:hypothetical protein